MKMEGGRRKDRKRERKIDREKNRRGRLVVANGGLQRPPEGHNPPHSLCYFKTGAFHHRPPPPSFLSLPPSLLSSLVLPLPRFCFSVNLGLVWFGIGVYRFIPLVGQYGILFQVSKPWLQSLNIYTKFIKNLPTSTYMFYSSPKSNYGNGILHLISYHGLIH